MVTQKILSEVREVADKTNLRRQFNQKSFKLLTQEASQINDIRKICQYCC